MIDEKLLMDILKSREDRRIFQESLIEKYKNTLISFTLNIPGRKKDSEKYRRLHKESMEYILEKLEEKQIGILYKKRLEKNTGPEGYISVNNNALATKILMIEIEGTHPLGRILDIDVFDEENKQISRKGLKLEVRKCLICSKDARICMRENGHTQEELLGKIDDIIEEYFSLTKN